MELNIGQLPEGNLDPTQLYTESRAEESVLESYLPKTGFIAKYMDYTKIHEAPSSFHLWTALSLLSAVVQRRTWLSRGTQRIYPNLYVVLVAASGRCRKTGAIMEGLKLANKLDFLNIIADKTTPEALLESLMNGDAEVEGNNSALNIPGMPLSAQQGVNINLDSTGFIRSTEMSTFLNKQTYTTGMVTLLTDLFDCPDTFVYRTRTRKPITLDNVFINMLAGTTPEWLATNLPEAAFEGGFMSRVIWVVKYWKDRIIPWEEEPDPKELELLVKMLRFIHDRHMGKMTLSQAAKDWYVQWYTHNTISSTDNEKLAGFHERLPDTMLKIAMLLQAADTPGIMELDLKYLIQSEKIIRWAIEKMFKAFEATELSRMGQLRRRLNEILDHYGEISQRDVMRKVAGRLDYKAQFDEIQSIMKEAGELVIEVKQGKTGRPKTVWRRPLQSEL